MILSLVYLSAVSASITSKHAARSSARPDKQRRGRTEGQPRCIAVLCRPAFLAELVARDAEERHVDCPGKDRGDSGERRGEGHEDGASAVVVRAAQTKENGEGGEAG